MFVIAYITVILVLLLYYLIRLPFQYWKNRNVPYPSVSYFFGNFGDIIFLKKSVVQVCDEIYKKYPNLPYVGFYKIFSPCILIRDTELIKEVMVKSFNSFQDNLFYIDKAIDPYFAKNSFASRGQVWKNARSISTPSFTTKKVKEMHPLIETAANNFVEYLNSFSGNNPDGVDIKEVSLKYTTDAVASCALGIQANSFVSSNSEYIKMIKMILSPSFINTIKYNIIFNFPSMNTFIRTRVVPKEAATYCRGIVRSTLEYRTKSNIHRGDFLDSMNELQHTMGKDVFTADDVTTHVLSFFTDGTETSSIVLSFTFYELALHADIQTNLRNEIEQTLQKHDGHLSYEAIQDMVYLDNVINESMRKNTTVPVFSRICTERFSLPSPLPNGKQVIVEPGTTVFISAHSIHHDPKYFSEPSVFDPTRFSDGNLSKQSKYTFLPFGEGPRICTGQKFAISQIKIGIIHVIQNFEVKLHPTTTVPYELNPRYFLLGAKKDIKLEFHKLN